MVGSIYFLFCPALLCKVSPNCISWQHLEYCMGTTFHQYHLYDLSKFGCFWISDEFKLLKIKELKLTFSFFFNFLFLKLVPIILNILFCPICTLLQIHKINTTSDLQTIFRYCRWFAYCIYIVRKQFVDNDSPFLMKTKKCSEH